MTNEEALQEIEKICESCKSLKIDECDDCVYPNAIKAIKKQIPKKPILTDHDHDEYFTKTVRCGDCGASLGSWNYGRAWTEGSKKYFIEHHKYCNECGIKIDWSEEDD